jgi:hypothetical protein
VDPIVNVQHCGYTLTGIVGTEAVNIRLSDGMDDKKHTEVVLVESSTGKHLLFDLEGFTSFAQGMAAALTLAQRMNAENGSGERGNNE